MDEYPESDRLLDLPHPREQSKLIGHGTIEQRLLQAFASGKMHHAWIFSGPRGIGKATLAYRFARFILKHPDPAELTTQLPANLSIDPADPVFRRVASGGHADIFVARRTYDTKAKRLRKEISAETVRKTAQFYSRTAGEGGWRICIVDAADDMNRTAANALLKVLEEPPARAVFILIAHNSGKLLPTIRSRCVTLPMKGLDESELKQVIGLHGGDMDPSLTLAELAVISRGSPGRAIALARSKGWSNFQEFRELVSSFPVRDYKACMTFAERIGARGAEEEYQLFFEILSDWLAAQVRISATGSLVPGTTDPNDDLSNSMKKTGLGAWSEAWQQISHSLARTNALNLDRKQTILRAIESIEQAAAAPLH